KSEPSSQRHNNGGRAGDGCLICGVGVGEGGTGVAGSANPVSVLLQPQSTERLRKNHVVSGQREHGKSVARTFGTCRPGFQSPRRSDRREEEASHPGNGLVRSQLL